MRKLLLLVIFIFAITGCSQPEPAVLYGDNYPLENIPDLLREFNFSESVITSQDSTISPKNYYDSQGRTVKRQRFNSETGSSQTEYYIYYEDGTYMEKSVTQDGQAIIFTLRDSYCSLEQYSYKYDYPEGKTSKEWLLQEFKFNIYYPETGLIEKTYHYNGDGSLIERYECDRNDRMLEIRQVTYLAGDVPKSETLTLWHDGPGSGPKKITQISYQDGKVTRQYIQYFEFEVKSGYSTRHDLSKEQWYRGDVLETEISHSYNPYITTRFDYKDGRLLDTVITSYNPKRQPVRQETFMDGEMILYVTYSYQGNQTVREVYYRQTDGTFKLSEE